MKKVILRMAVITSMVLAVVSCQEDNQLDNLAEEQTIAQEKPQLPEVINVTSATPIPDELAGRGVSARSLSNISGTYMGVLQGITMKGKPKNDVQNMPVIIKKTGNGFRFEIKPFKVGRMPGNLDVNIDKIKLNSDGTFHATLKRNKKLKRSVHLHFFGHHYYDTSLIKGKFTTLDGGNKLEFILNCDKSVWNIEIFKAHIEYEGNNN